MDIRIGENTVGSLYVNIQLPLKNFEGKSHNEIIDLIKGTHGVEQQVFKLSIGDFKISSFRRIYKDDLNICVEGAELSPVIKEVSAETTPAA